MTIAGFTGTQHGMDRAQRADFFRLLTELDVTELHLGDCIGADEDAYILAAGLCRLIGHPPTNPSKRTFLPFDEELPLLPYINRNHRIVDAAELLIATPYSEERRNPYSGTWATIRYARKVGKPVHIIWPLSVHSSQS